MKSNKVVNNFMNWKKTLFTLLITILTFSVCGDWFTPPPTTRIGPNDIWYFTTNVYFNRLYIGGNSGTNGVLILNGVEYTSLGSSSSIEHDPVFTQSVASLITSSATTRWETAYQWGDHRVAGYLTTISNNSVGGDQIINNSITTEDIGTDAVGSDEIVDNSINKIDVDSSIISSNSIQTSGDVTGKWNNATVVALKNKALPTLTIGFLYYDGSTFSFSTAGVGDMLKSVYDVNNNNQIDTSATAGIATNALRFGTILAPTTPGVGQDEYILAYDHNIPGYKLTDLSALGGGDMLKSVYDTNVSTIGTVDKADIASIATWAAAATNALRFGNVLAPSYSSSVDEYVMTYDHDISAFKLVSLGDLGGGDMLKANYDVNDNNEVDLTETSRVSRSVIINSIHSSNIINGTITNDDIAANASIAATKIQGTAVTYADTISSGDVEGTINSLTVIKIRNKTVDVPTIADDGKVLYYDHNTSTFKYKIESGGSFEFGYSEKTSNYTIVETDYTINCISNSFGITLPDATSKTGAVYNIKNMGNGIITVYTILGQLIDEYTDGEYKVYRKENLTIQSTGNNWIIL